MKLHIPLSCAGLEYVTEITQIPDQVDAVIELLHNTVGNLEMVACLAGGEAVLILPMSFPNTWYS
jgi:hypothetical protein